MSHISYFKATTLTSNLFFNYKSLHKSTGFLKTVFVCLFIIVSISLNSVSGAIAQRGSVSTNSSASTSVAINVPSGVVQGDIMFATLSVYDSGKSAGVSTCTGWTQISTGQLGGTNRSWGTLMYRIATSSEPASYTFNTGSASRFVGSIIAFSGVDGSSPFDVTPLSSFTTASATSVSPASITTVSPNAAIVMLSMISRVNTTTTGNFNSWTTTSPGTLTEICDYGYNGTTSAGVGAAWAIKASAGATGSGLVTLALSARIGAQLIALRPLVPTITTSVSTLTGFNYIVGSGPSAQQSFTVSGSNLTANIILSPPTNYEISSTSGTGFQSTPITLTQSGGNVATTTIYVRLKSGLAVGSYNSQNVNLTSTGATTKTVSCSGTVSNVPLITVTPTGLSGFTYIAGYGPSTQQSFTVSGSYLTANITVTPPTNYEISTTSGSGFSSSPIILTQSGGTVASTAIYVRLKAGLAVGNYNSENIVSTSTNAVAKNVSCSGTVTNTPLITVTPSSLSGFSYTLGNGPSAQQSFTVSGSYLTSDIIVTPSTNYEISSTSGSGFQSTSIILTQTAGSVSNTTIYVRLKAGLTAGTYNSENIVSTSTYAVTKNVSCNGTVNQPTIATSVSSLTGFSYISGSGPSAQQSFTISGSNLTDNIVLTPPTNYEISVTSGTGFQSTPITLTQSGGNVATTTIYVRLKAGLAAGSYNSENIVSTSTNADTKNVSCSGAVGAPTITTSTSALSGYSYAVGAGPSTEQSFTVSGTFLSSNISITPPTDFEISLTSGTGFQSTPITLSQSGGNVATSTIYVRMKSGLAIGTYSSENIVLTSTGATTKNVANTGNVYVAYCASSGDMLDQTGITLVNFNTINNLNLTKSAGYSDLTNLVTNVYVGNTYTLTVNLNTGGNYTELAMAWIDWKNDGDFADAGETYNLGSATNQTNGPTSLSPLSITIPTNAVATTTRMRIACQWNTLPVLCSNMNYGEVEDYSINIISPTISTSAISGSPFSTGSTVSVPFTITGSFAAGNIFTAQLSNSSGSFATPVNIGTLTSTASGTISATIPTNTPSGNGYRIRVISSNPVITGTNNGTNLTIVGQPVITTSTTGLTGFTYPVGYGPSSTQSFTVSGTNLTGNITLTPSTNYQISTTDSPSFVASSLITLPVVSGSVSNTTIYVRLKSELALGTYSSDSIVAITSGAITKKVGCSGSVVTAPVITTSAISGSFSYVFGSGPSAQQTFTVSGTNLISNVTITPPTDFEISTTSGSGFVSTPISLTPTSGTLSSRTIYVRLKTGLGVGSYSEDVVASATSAVSKNVAVSGTITASTTIFNAISFLSGFVYTLGSGPSGIQSFVVKAVALTADVTVTPPTNFEISKNGVNFQSTAFTLLRSGTTLTTDTIVYVRMKSGLAVGTYGPLNSSVVLTSAGAITKSVACKGQVVSSSTLLASNTTLTGFGYEFSYGPSTPQILTVSGASLTANMVVTAPANYEISTSPGSGYTTSLTFTGATVNPTKVYVRLKSGLTAGNYGTLASPVNISITSSGATSLSVSLIGKVFASPLITATGGGNYCEGETINLSSTGADIQSFYWTGPNGYYSASQNPVLTTNATPSLNGTYIVNGSVAVGGNLITNGDFEAGNTSFSSGYGYVTPSASALYPEALYTIVKLASSVHNDFTNYPGHKAGTVGDFTDVNSYQMVVNGAPTAGVVVWSQSVPVIPGATYQFSYSEQTVNITQVPKNASRLQLYVNGVAAGPVYTAPEVNYQWATFVYNAEAGTNTVLNLELINQNTVAAGNDFALDDIVFQQILPATASTNVTVSPKVPVSLSIAAAPGTEVYSNTTVTFTATPTNGGLTPSYQWQVNGVNVGSNSPVYSYIPNDGDRVKCILTSSLTCVTNNPAADSLDMIVNDRTNYWYGYYSTDWGNPGNWTGNYVPASGEDVEYATLANTPDSATFAVRDLWLDHDRTIGSLINATIRRLVIPAGKGLTVNNTVNTDGSVDRIYIYGSDTEPHGSLSFHNLESQPVSATVEMYSKASINHINDTINNKYKWQYFGSPLRSVKASPTFNGSYVRKWYETGTTIQNHWIQLQNDSTIYPFYGYEICQESPRYVYFKGQLVNSNFNSGELAITPTALYPGQHVFANPYTAAIDITQLEFGANVEASVYLYNTGTFSIWEFNGEGTSRWTSDEGQYLVVPKNTAGSLGLPSQVPSMQSMLVKALAPNNATFNINYNSVVVNNTDLQRVKARPGYSERVCTKIDVVGKEYTDKMWLFSDPTCSRRYDNGWDGYKILGSSLNPQIFAVEPDGNYQVNAVDDINNTILAFQAGKDAEYDLVFTQQNLQRQYQKVYLLDLVENKTIDITESGTVYKFYAESTPKPVNRFQIVTRPYEAESSDVDSNVKVFSAGKNIFVHNEGDSDGELIVYDIYGRYLLKKPFVANAITTVLTNYITGGYIVRIKTAKEEFSKRIIITK